MFRILRLLALPLIGLLALTSFHLGCKGISGSGVSQSARYESGYRSLRIGQINSANNKVVTTMAIDNREAIVVLEPAPGTPSLTEVLYQSQDAMAAQIFIGENSLPVKAVTNDTTVTFSNYTDGSVTLNIQNLGSDLPPQTVPLDPEIFSFFDADKSIHRSKDLSENNISRIFRLAIVAVRVFGCASQNYIGSQTSSPPFGLITDSACGSTLVTTMLNVDKTGEYENRFVENYAGDPLGCSYEGDSYLDAVSCLDNSVDEVIQDALISDPEIDDALDENFDPETGEIIPDVPEDPTPDPENTPNQDPNNPSDSPSASPTPDPSIPPLDPPPVPGDPQVEGRLGR